MKQNILLTDQFSSKKVSFDMLIPYTKEDYTYLHFIGKLLPWSNKFLPTTKKLTIAYENLYNSSITTDIALIGNHINLRVTATYLNILDDEEEDKLLKIFYDTIFNPNVVSGEWNELDFNDAKNKISHSFLTYKDDPGWYASHEGSDLLAPGTGLGGFPEGDYGIFNEINKNNVYEYYNNFLKVAKFQYFAMGNFTNKIDLKLSNLFGLSAKDLKIKYLDCKINNNIARKEELYPQKQTIIQIGFKFENLTEFERKYVIPIFDDLFGGQVGICKLFKKVRLERGYAYYIHSQLIANSNLLMVSSGIRSDKVEETLKLINESLIELKSGDFEERLVNELITVYEDDLNAMYDKKGYLFGQLFAEYNDLTDAIPVKAQNYQKVTKEAVVQAAKKLSLASIYILAGDKK